MSAFNISFFTKDLEFVTHASCPSVEIDDDYVSPEATTFYLLLNKKIQNGQFVYITEANFLGIVTEEPVHDKYVTTVSVKPFICLFDAPIIFDLYSQTHKKSNEAHGQTLEEVIFNRIDMYWGEQQSDKCQRLNRMNLTYDKAVTSWNLMLESSKVTNDNRYTTKNLLTDILSMCSKKYRIIVSSSIDFNKKVLNIHIGIPNSPSKKIIEIDEDNVKVNEFKAKSGSTKTNKLVVYNGTKITGAPIVYYLYDDDDHTYGLLPDTGNEELKRILPVVQEISIVNPGDDPTSVDYEPFSTLAEQEAKSTFEGIDWQDLIEITVSASDTQIRPKELIFGQLVTIIHDNKAYKTVLTGKKTSSELVTLSFGYVRADLTKKMNLLRS